MVAVSKKPGRLEKISSMVREVIESGHVSKSQLASLHGLVNFAGGYTLGYQLKPTARMLSLALSSVGPGTRADLRSSCEVALTAIAIARPRVCHSSLCAPLFLYTDGTYEGKEGSWGAIVIDTVCQRRWVFSGRVPELILKRWADAMGDQLICQVEAYAVAIMLFALRGTLNGRSVLAFIDNDPCRFAFIRRFSPSPALMGLVTLVSILEAANETSIWYERVASSANPADLPSRFAVGEACRRFGCQDKGDVAITSEMQQFLTSRAYDPAIGSAIAETIRAESDVLRDITSK